MRKMQVEVFLKGFSFVLCTAAFTAAGCRDSGETETGDESLDEYGCEQECTLQIYSPCTCGTDDPCGWQDEGFCDRKCLFNDIVENMFNDALDCPGLCDGACEAGLYSACSCAEDDPCGWKGDNKCDLACIEDSDVDVMFDDRKDCGSSFGDAGM